jgi:hypothetical protein
MQRTDWFGWNRINQTMKAEVSSVKPICLDFKATLNLFFR